ncbi:hypothetical protein DEO72_LG8g1172 [Vigna unguiculata]|uniref:Uncharacterized protein n=1 Tax=Vigna unguiculata TaxID=3917 RepID=A0A4D6MNP6_VIGUN|nr:hypothetical protein DEO72_LG8g1172 [Vigna unguiculata]
MDLRHCRRVEERNCDGAVASIVPSLGAPPTLQTPSQRNSPSSAALQLFASRKSTRIRLRCCHGGRESSSMCKGGARAGVVVEMMVWQREDELSMRGCVAESLDVVQICVTVMLVLRSRFRCCNCSGVMVCSRYFHGGALMVF